MLYNIIMLLRVNYIGIFTARVRSTREGNIYTWECLSVHHFGGWGGIPSQVWWWGVPHLRSGGGGYPIPGLARGVPYPRSGWGGGTIPGLVGGTPSQVWPGWYPIPGRGEVPHLRSGGTQSIPPAQT